MEWIQSASIVLFLVVFKFPGVSAEDSDIVGITVAACISFVLLSLIVAMIIISFSWRDWFNNWMKRRNKVRMPKWYWQKKEESKRRLLNGSSTSHPPSRAPSEVNGKLPAQSVDREGQAASWVQGWNQRSSTFDNRVYEEKDKTIVLGEEQDEEFKIETVLVDNETLDVGPYKHDHSHEMAMQGDVYNEPYIYSTVDNTRKSVKSQKDFMDTEIVENAGVTATRTTTTTLTTTETANVDATITNDNGEKVTNFDDMFVQL